MAKPDDEINAFLSRGEPEPAAPEPAPQPAPVESKPDPAPAAAVTPPAEPEDDEPPAAQDGEAVVPRRALEDERHKRQDWKIKATKAETERDELRKQLEEAKRAPPVAQPHPAAQPQPIDPAQDPQGFVQRIQGVVLNERLNVSEMMLRKELGAEKVDGLIAEFKQAAQSDPSLFQKLYAQPHPYEWAAQQVEVMRLQREIGTDPGAYRERIRAEAIAEFQKTNAAPARISPAAGMAPSLANARSVAGRSAPSFTGPTPLADILKR